MATLIVALFVIIAVWGWYLIPKKGGAHQAAATGVREWGSKNRVQRMRAKQDSDVRVIPAAGTQAGVGAPVQVVGGTRTNASTRRRRVRTSLIGMAVLSLAIAFYTGSANWWITHVAVDALLIIYYGLAMHIEANAAARPAVTTRSAREEAPPTLRRVSGS